MKAMTFRLDDDVYIKFKKKLLDDNMSVQQFITNQVQNYIKEEIKMNLQALENKFGSVTHNGVKYILTDIAEPTNRLINDYPNHNNPDDGNYLFEMASSAVDLDGNKHMVYWIFLTVTGDDGNTVDYDYYDYSDENVDRVEVL